MKRHIPITSNITIIPAQYIYWPHAPPQGKDVELFDIWGEKVSNGEIFDAIVGESVGNSLDVYVNGKKMTYAHGCNKNNLNNI
jgi:hypothetical protein